MTTFVRCANEGVKTDWGFDCMGLYRPADPDVCGDEPRIHVELLGYRSSFFDAAVSGAEAVGIRVCPDCPARRPVVVVVGDQLNVKFELI